MIYQFMQANKNRYSIKEMAGVLGVSRSAYYKWEQKQKAVIQQHQQQKTADEELLELIKEIIARHLRRYGSPRVRKELQKAHGIRVSRKKVARLMRENGLNARRRKKFIKTTDSKHGFEVNENILDRQFRAGRPGEKWVSDITCLSTEDGWVYLTVVLDLFDRKILGWALSADMESVHTSIAALEMAVRNRRPQEGLIFHSDRGVQYCARCFRAALQSHCPSVRQSMSRKGNCQDNACAESFFRTLKGELETLEGKHNSAEVRQAVFFYIEAYYNRVRLHSALDYVAPDVFYLRNAA